MRRMCNVVVFEKASCRMAINAHSWKLLRLFTQKKVYSKKMLKICRDAATFLLR